MVKSKTLSDTIGEIVIYGGDDGDIEWTLAELEFDAPWTIRDVIIEHLRTMKKPVAKKLVFGDVESRDNAVYNQIVDDLILDLEEGRV